MARETAQDRARKNIHLIHTLITDVQTLVNEKESTLINAPNQINWGDVGDLASYREHLNDLLGREDKDPE